MLDIWTIDEEARRLHARFDKLKIDQSVGQAQFARDFGVTGGASMVSQHIKARRPMSLDAAITYARAFGCSLEEISPRFAAEVSKATAQSAALIPIDLENNPDYPSIRRARFKLSAGASGFAVEYEQGDGAPMVFGKAWYAKRGLTPDKLFAVQVANGSMEPGLHHGDTVVVNTEATEPKDGSVFAVNYEGELCIKRLIRDAGQWWLSSDNNDQRRYPRKVCGEGVFLIGEIVHKQSERI